MTEDVPYLYPSEPLSVRLMNTIWADRDGIHDSLTTVEHLRRWSQLSALRGSSRFTAAELAAFRRLRDALRRIAAEVTGDERPRAVAPTSARSAVADLNAVAGKRMPVLMRERDGYALKWQTKTRGAALTLSELALQAAQIFSDPEEPLRACHGPGCVLYYVKDHPRRGWCSAVCGNRARVARHYRKHHP